MFVRRWWFWMKKVSWVEERSRIEKRRQVCSDQTHWELSEGRQRRYTCDLAKYLNQDSGLGIRSGNGQASNYGCMRAVQFPYQQVINGKCSLCKWIEKEREKKKREWGFFSPCMSTSGFLDADYRCSRRSFCLIIPISLCPCGPRFRVVKLSVFEYLGKWSSIVEIEPAIGSFPCLICPADNVVRLLEYWHIDIPVPIGISMCPYSNACVLSARYMCR